MLEAETSLLEEALSKSTSEPCLFDEECLGEFMSELRCRLCFFELKSSPILFLSFLCTLKLLFTSRAFISMGDACDEPIDSDGDDTELAEK